MNIKFTLFKKINNNNNRLIKYRLHYVKSLTFYYKQTIIKF